MILQTIKFIILFLILCNLPTYLLGYFGGSLGSLASYSSSLLLLAYFFLIRIKNKPLYPFVLLGIFYHLISAINYNLIDIDNYFIREFVRFMILVICGVEVLYNSSKKDIYPILLVGGVSIIIHALVFSNAQIHSGANYGRFSGFYLNPNFGGAICLMGYALSFGMKKYWKLSGQLIFTLGGLLTFSRTFILVWLVISFLSIIKDRKNLIVPLIGSVTLTLILIFSGKLTLNKERFESLESIFSNSAVKTEVIREDTRMATWAMYYDQLFDNPIIGNGWMSFQRKVSGLPGIHNTYLMVFGESGFFPFFLLIGIYSILIFRSLKIYHTHPEYFYLSCVLVLYLMTSHTYFSNFYMVTISMFVYIKTKSYMSHSIHTLNSYK